MLSVSSFALLMTKSVVYVSMHVRIAYVIELFWTRDRVYIILFMLKKVFQAQNSRSPFIFFLFFVSDVMFLSTLFPSIALRTDWMQAFDLTGDACHVDVIMWLSFLIGRNRVKYVLAGNSIESP